MRKMIVQPKATISSPKRIVEMSTALSSHGNSLGLDLPGKNGRSLASATIGPMTILGGTIGVYSAALRHSSCTLTPLSVFYLLLLALQYSIMPRISKKYVNKRVNKESVALVEEVVKMSIGAGFFLIGPDVSSLKDWSLSSSLVSAGLPSVLYAVQGVLTYHAYQNLDPVTFNGLTQIKTLSAALCCFLIMGKLQSKLQIFALGMLSLSTLIFQGTLGKILSRSSRGTAGKHHSENDVTANSSSKQQALKTAFAMGVLPCLGATFLSGLAGAFSQKGLQIVGGSGRNAYLYTVEISFFSGICLLLSILMKRLVASRSSMNATSINGIKDNEKKKVVSTAGYFDHWTWKTLIPIVVKACGGMLTALVHKHAGSVVKGFSLVLGLVLSGVFQSIIDDKDLSFDQVFGTSLVLLSSWLHFTNPVVSSPAIS